MAAFAGEQGTVTSDRLDVFLLAHLPTGVPGPHLGCLGGSRERPCISWLIVRGLGTGLGALDFLHQMAKPPMSLEQGAGTGGNQCSEKPGIWGIFLSEALPHPNQRTDFGPLRSASPHAEG